MPSSTAANLFHSLSSTMTTTLLSAASAAGGDQRPGGGPLDSVATTTLLLDAATTTTEPPGGGGAGGRPAPPDYLLHTQFVCERVLVPLVVSFGIVGNLLSLVVLTRKEMASPTNCFLTALAISDLSLLLLQVPMFFGLNADIASTDSFQIFLRYYIVIMYVMTNVFLTCTCWLTVAVTVERFLSLRFMMHPRVVCSVRRAKRAILAIFFASFLFHFSKFFEYVPNTDLRSPRPLLPTELSLNKAYDTAMHVANITLAALVPIVALIIFNTFLIYFLATHRRRMLKHKSKSGLGLGNGNGSSHGGSGGGGGGTTSVDMLHVSSVVVAVVLVFVACHSLGVFVALNIAVHGRHKIFSDHLFVAFKHVNSLLVVVNSSVNFLLYCSISRKFRKMFTTVFCQRLLSKSAAWSLPVPLSENSMATAVSIRSPNGNGYSRGGGGGGGGGGGCGSKVAKGGNHDSGNITGGSRSSNSAKEASFFHPSPSVSSASRSADHVEL